jgi:hypothetical protein
MCLREALQPLAAVEPGDTAKASLTIHFDFRIQQDRSSSMFPWAIENPKAAIWR